MAAYFLNPDGSIRDFTQDEIDDMEIEPTGQTAGRSQNAPAGRGGTGGQSDH